MEIDQERLRAELNEMKELIANDPRVLARFDADGNGVIDGEEWEAVRQVVIERLRREAMEAELARQLREQLDDEQAAELARLEADIAAEERAPAAESVGAPDEDDGAATADDDSRDTEEDSGREWDNLELAFDPREDPLSRRQSVAEQVYEKELVGRRGARSRSARSVRESEHGTLADCFELVLEQVGGAKQFFGNMFRREYIVRDARGDEVGRIGQRENEMLQNLTDYSILEDPDLNFHVYDRLTDEEFRFRRTSGLSDNSISVHNPRDMVIARSSWTLSFLRRKYEVRVVRDSISYYVRRRLLNPWTFDVLDAFDDPIGQMQRGWSGIGFLTGGNLFHIEIDRDVSPDAMWGFLATAVLADLDSESGSRKAGFDFFNG